MLAGALVVGNPPRRRKRSQGDVGDNCGFDGVDLDSNSDDDAGDDGGGCDGGGGD